MTTESVMNKILPVSLAYGVVAALSFVVAILAS